MEDSDAIASDPLPPGPESIAGKRIALVGRLGGMNRREATNLLRSYSATVVDPAASGIDLLVIGGEESPLSEAELLTDPIRVAAAAGELEIVQETELWQRLGLVDIQQSIKRYYTPAMLAHLLGVSVRVIRRWHRRGLIIPTRSMHHLPFFDFQEVATARRLAELVAAGASPQAIESRLRELAAILPEVGRPLAQLSVLIEGKRVLLRQGEGLIEPGGQLRFDFTASEQAPSPETTFARLDSAAGEAVTGEIERTLAFPGSTIAAAANDELLAAAYEFEDEGDLTSAIDSLRAILARDGLRSDIAFQLGELLYRDGQIEAARERYYQAIEIDGGHVEARVSLGCVLAETGRHDLAIAAFEGVLSLVPDYPDAHYNLASAHEAMGDQQAAAFHWQAYRALVPSSPWGSRDPADDTNPNDSHDAGPH